MTVRSLIDRHLAEFSASDTRVARSILERYPVSALGGIEDIARQSSVSPPTVTRFVKRLDRKSTRLNSSHSQQSRMPSSA